MTFDRRDGLLLTLSGLSAWVARNPELWIDERITRRILSDRSILDILTVVPQNQPHIPTYYLLGKLVGFRGLQVVSIIAFIATVLLTRRLYSQYYGSDQYSTIAAATVAVSPYLATQATWHRMYAPLVCAGAITLYYIQTNRDGLAVGVGIAAFLLHPFGAFLIAVAVLSAAIRHDRNAMAYGLISVPAVLWFLYTHIGNDGFTEESTDLIHTVTPNLLSMVFLPIAPLAGTTFDAARVNLALLLLLLIWYPLPYRNVVAFLLLPVLGTIIISYTFYPVFRPKYVGFILPAVALLVTNPARNQWHQYGVWAIWTILMLLMWRFVVSGAVMARYFTYTPRFW